MSSTRKELLDYLVQLDQADQLPMDGPISVFLRSADGKRHSQMTIYVEDEKVFIRTSRIPFIGKKVFSLKQIRAAAQKRSEQA